MYIILQYNVFVRYQYWLCHSQSSPSGLSHWIVTSLQSVPRDYGCQAGRSLGEQCFALGSLQSHPEQGTELALSLSPSSLSPNATQRAEGQPLPSLPHLGHIFLTVSFKKNPKACTFSRLGKQPKQPEPLPAFHPIPNPYKPLLPLFLFLLFFFLVYFFHYSLIPFRSAVSGKDRRKGKSYILLHAANPYESSAP